MTMTFSLHESIEPSGGYDSLEQTPQLRVQAAEPAREDFYLLREKLRVPSTDGFIERPRLNALFARARSQFPATLISGRAGTGKTALAASFAAANDNVSWYTVESTDVCWT